MFVTFIHLGKRDGHIDPGLPPRSVVMRDNSLLHLHITQKLSVEITEFGFLSSRKLPSFQVSNEISMS